MMFVGFIMIPIGTALYVLHPAWSCLYWVGPDGASFMHVVLLWFLCLGGALGAFLLGEMLCRRGLVRLLEVALGSGLALLLLFFLLYGDRFGRLSDDGQWETAPLLLGSNVGTIFGFAIPVVLGGWIYLLVLFELEGRKFQRAVVDANRFNQPAPAVGANWMATPSAAKAFEVAENGAPSLPKASAPPSEGQDAAPGAPPLPPADDGSKNEA